MRIVRRTIFRSTIFRRTIFFSMLCRRTLFVRTTRRSTTSPTALFLAAALAAAVLPSPVGGAQTAKPSAPRIKHVLVIGQTKVFEHDSISAAMVAIYEMGRDSGLWDTELRTDTEPLTRRPMQHGKRSIDYFDAIVFASTTGELDMDAAQKKDFLAFIHDDGKGFVGVHAALDTFHQWPEYGEMIGGYFDDHPWTTFDAPILNEGGDFPATRHLPAAFTKHDEIYQVKTWSRDKVNVLLSLDASKLVYAGNPRIHRTDRDFPVAWSKRYGTGRVFYSSLGHTRESWSDPDIRTMYFEAIKWSLHLTDGSTQSHARR